ncbi:MAG: SMC-Scp complex subunit ScpB [Candidatus Omnitrophica bacterium]|nr:SMC-Scp complex subunit ScpB [Candidatus Omnitrophota bacterium]
MDDNPLRSVIEALLFASDKPVTAEQMRKVLDNAEGAPVKQAVEELRMSYARENRGIAIIEVAGGFQMVTAPQYSPFLQKLFRERHPDKLSRSAMETLAIIAYKQPLTRQEIQLLRNVNVDGVIRTLVDRSLVRITGRKQVPGRPHVYGTTRQFLEYFGLKSLRDLPKLEELPVPDIELPAPPDVPANEAPMEEAADAEKPA